MPRMNAYRQFPATAMQALLLTLCACGGQASLTAPSQLPPAPSAVSGAGSTSTAPAFAQRTHERREFRSVLPRAQGVPLVLPVWSSDKDAGAVADRHLFSVIQDTGWASSRSIAANCPGVSSTSTCEPYKYVNFFHNPCNTAITLAAYQYANSSDEDAILHTYPNGKTKSNRFDADSKRSRCAPDNTNATVRMNPGDPKLNAWLYNNVWNGSNYDKDFPSPYGIMEDTAGVLAFGVVGGAPGAKVSTEYGSGVNPSGFADQVGNSRYHDPTDFETAIGIFVNGACGRTCHNVAFNGVATGAGDVGACSVIRGGHCHAAGSSGMIDDQAAINNICTRVSGGNLKYMQAERPVYSGRLGFSLWIARPTMGINTISNLYSHTSGGCANTKIVDIEVSYGAGGPGDITGGYRVRLAALAWRWLVANPATGIPDRVTSQQTTVRGTPSEIGYFFEDTLVPAGAEVSVPKFVWNGRVQTVGGGCPSRDGDSGGAVSLLSQCVGSSGSFVSNTSISTSMAQTTARRQLASTRARRPSASQVRGSSTTRSHRIITSSL